VAPIRTSATISRPAGISAFRRPQRWNQTLAGYRQRQEVYMKKEIGFAIALCLLLFGPALLAQQRAAGQPASPDLVAALKSSPGCLGVETARTAGGKQVIFAWFENKKALLDWYYSPVHQQLMTQFFPNAAAHKPMPDVPDNGQPILAVASLTMSDKPPSAITTMPVSQIAIELYQPLPGGIALGGRFAPTTMNVPGLTDVPFPSAAK
jgi:hypothetical protein